MKYANKFYFLIISLNRCLENRISAIWILINY